jgi:hypothetical protein
MWHDAINPLDGMMPFSYMWHDVIPSVAGALFHPLSDVRPAIPYVA